MTKININRKQLLSFLSDFGKNAEDLHIKFTVEDDVNWMQTTVAFISHYLKKKQKVQGEVIETGSLDISELVKVRQFLKAGKADTVRVVQLGSAKTLSITCGGSKVTMPTSSTTVSHSKAVLFNKLIDAAVESKWTKFHDCNLTVSGVITLDELTTVSKMRGILNSSPVFKVTAHASENEFLISSGKRHETKLFTTLELRDSTGPAEGSVVSTFGPWLMDNIALLGNGDATIHMGEGTILAIEKEDDLLVIVDQRV
tara:strand:+ start:37 stop:804 length:768 start_codon:yes stop_codon:yes gene_type:complete